MCTLLAGTSPWCTAWSYHTAKSLAVSRPGERCQKCLSNGQTLILYWNVLLMSISIVNLYSISHIRPSRMLTCSIVCIGMTGLDRS